MRRPKRSRGIRASGAPLAVLLLLALAAGCSEGEAPPIQSAILVSIDTLRPDRLGAYGSERGTSPAIDRLAAQGLVFEQIVAQAPWTAPSHASMLTSLYPSVLNMGDFAAPGRISGRVDTLAEVLKRQGFRTRAVVAGGFLDPAIGFDQGFDTYEKDGLDMATVVDRAIAWLDEVGSGERFFLFLHTYDVHKYFPPEEDLSRFLRPYDGEIELTRGLAQVLQDNRHLEEVKAMSAADRRFVEDVYDASVAAVDREVDRLVRHLEASGRGASTLLVLTSDHGEEFWEHGRSGHGYSLHDENLLVPLVLVHPSLPPARVEAQGRLLDLAPTIVDLLGVPAPEYWQGQSLLPLVSGRGGDRPAFSEHSHLPFKSVRSDGEKYILSLRRPRQRYFDLEKDAREQQNLAGHGLGQEERMKEALRRWIETNGRDTRFADGGAAELDDATLDQLRELGYLGGDEGAAGEPLERWLEALEDRQDLPAGG